MYSAVLKSGKDRITIRIKRGGDLPVSCSKIDVVLSDYYGAGIAHPKKRRKKNVKIKARNV